MLEPLDHINPEDFQTEQWKRLTKFLSARLQELRESNDASLDPVRTSEIRGSISEVKKILALAEHAGAGEQPVQVEDLDGFPGY